MAPTPCNSNSMWKCPLVPVGLLLSGVGVVPTEEPRPRTAEGGRQAVSRPLRPSAQGSDL